MEKSIELLAKDFLKNWVDEDIIKLDSNSVPKKFSEIIQYIINNKYVSLIGDSSIETSAFGSRITEKGKVFVNA